MARLLVLLLLACAWACAPAEPVAPEGPVRRLRLLTWNVHNLFDAVDDPYEDDVLAPAEVDAKIARLARVIQGADADLVALQEIEKATLLQRLAARAGYSQMIFEEGNDTIRGIDVAFMARVPVDGYASHAGDRLPDVLGAPPGYRFSRDCLEVHVAPLVILVNHLKSQATGGRESDAKRRAQALRVQEIAAGHRYVAVVGDLNAPPESWSLEPLLGGDLVDPFRGRPLAERATYVRRNRATVLDYILVSPSVRVVEARVLTGAEVEASSDHRPVLAELEVPARAGGPSGTGESPRP